MKRTRVIAIALGITLGTASIALAQPVYGPYATPYGPNPPAYVPDASYNPYVPYPAPVVAMPPPVYAVPYQDTHTDGGASRAYSYGGGQKTN